MAVMWILLYNMIASLADLNYATWSVWDAQVTQVMLAVAAGSSVTLANAVFFLVVGVLTELEMHRRYTQFRRHRLLKLCVYRLVNTSAMFVWSYYAELPWNLCVTKRVALQHLVFVLSDLVLNNIIALLNPFLFRAVCQFCNPCCYGGDDNTDRSLPIWPEFELSDEYLVRPRLFAIPRPRLLSLCTDQRSAAFPLQTMTESGVACRELVWRLRGSSPVLPRR